MQFLQKQLAEPWKEELGINRPDLPRLDERVEDYADGKRIEGEVKRFATIDVQRDHYWVAIRAWRTDGSSVGLWYGRVNTEEVCAELVSRYQIEPQHVYVDTGYDSGRVYDIICRFGWCGIRGDGQQRAFRHKSRRGHQEKLYSPIKHALAPCGSRARYFFIAVEPIKDILVKLRGGDGAKWEILEGLPREYEEQLDSEVKEEFLAPKTNQSQHRWVKKRKANHAWDCEVYQVGAALVWGMFGE
jgi:phage terminase large subunit GpA-like protein